MLVPSKCRFWDAVLTDAQREELGDAESGFKRYGGVIGVWRKFNGGNQPQAIVECAWRLGPLTSSDREWLLREIEKSLDVPTVAARSVNITWKPETEELLLNGQLIRKVRVMKFNNVPRILDAFEAAGWPQGVACPLSAGQQTLHDTLRTLNRGLKQIRFHAQRGGTYIYWKLTIPS